MKIILGFTVLLLSMNVFAAEELFSGSYELISPIKVVHEKFGDTDIKIPFVYFKISDCAGLQETDVAILPTGRENTYYIGIPYNLNDYKICEGSSETEFKVALATVKDQLGVIKVNNLDFPYDYAMEAK